MDNKKMENMKTGKTKLEPKDLLMVNGGVLEGWYADALMSLIRSWKKEGLSYEEALRKAKFGDAPENYPQITDMVRSVYFGS